MKEKYCIVYGGYSISDLSEDVKDVVEDLLFNLGVEYEVYCLLPKFAWRHKNVKRSK